MYQIIEQILRQRGLLFPGESAQIEPLGGGVSNHVLLVITPRQRMVIKQSLPKLRVEMEWLADQARIWRERDYLLLVAEILPDQVPQVLFSDEEHYLLAISEIAEATVWKQFLVAGDCNPQLAAQAGELLARIHTYSASQPALAQTFQHIPGSPTDSFEQLRVDPYLRTVARRHPDIAAQINAVIGEMEAQPLALVHGDFSPKNILVKPNGTLVLLDAEVAHWGDPTFDVAFALNHFLLKAIYHAPNQAAFLQGANLFWQHYQTTVVPALAESVAERLGGQLAALLLARVDGKSPVEYLVGDAPRQAAVRRLARAALLNYPATTVMDLVNAVAEEQIVL